MNNTVTLMPDDGVTYTRSRPELEHITNHDPALILPLGFCEGVTLRHDDGLDIELADVDDSTGERIVSLIERMEAVDHPYGLTMVTDHYGAHGLCMILWEGHPELQRLQEALQQATAVMDLADQMLARIPS